MSESRQLAIDIDWIFSSIAASCLMRSDAALVAHGYQWCRTPEELKALSQNLGHSQVATTLTSYGTIALHRQRELIRGAGRREDQQEKMDRLMALLEQRLI